ncbi:MAG: S46 family peptidase [Bacteroidales bacterium]|jgi:V8-like Glu-specific endopeptidase|nr:S46 family peptidase [Bacteroidales bacterium]
MKKIILPLIATLFFTPQFRADEGIWLPNLLKKQEADMQSKGLQISAEDIYSETQPSLKDAIVKFDGGCTAEFISKEGLLLTNHHCGYDQIQYHSTVEKDYLQYGFWAKSKGEELPCPGLKVSMIVKTVDVTDLVNEGITVDMNERQADSIRGKNIQKVYEREGIEPTPGKHAEVIPAYGGNAYFLYYSEVFEDVRFVAAPPSNIGKFGGDTDNWVWPRHTGDFSMFRVYADSNNNPARYSETNVPYQPKQYFKISLDGAEQDEFTFVFGYPGRTNEYLTSYAIRQTTEIVNPIAIAARTKRLDIIKTAMNSDPKTRIQYSAKAASIANAWKKWQGEIRGIKRADGIAKKEAFEKSFQEWANSYNNGQYKELLPELKTAYLELEPAITQNTYFLEHVRTPEVVQFSGQFINELIALIKEQNISKTAFQVQLDKLKERGAQFFKDFDADVDKEIFKTMSLVKIDGVEMRFVDFPDKDFDKYVDEMYAKSMFANEEKFNAVMKKLSFSNALKTLGKDPVLNYTDRVYAMYNAMIAPMLKDQTALINNLQRTYMKAQMEMQPDKNFYPDANGSLRVAYGKVAGFSPSDAVTYDYYSTLSGLIAKENPDIFDYVVEDKLKKLYNDKDFGDYANAKGEMPIAFIASNHTSGGNSGSPVLNGRGEIIGLNFDRCWEGTMSDLMFDENQCRNISMDIRFLLFMIDKYAGATHLLEELELVR